MYRRPKFLEVLLKIRQEMAREADYDADLFAEMIRSDSFSKEKGTYDLSENKEIDKTQRKTKSKAKKLEKNTSE